MLSNADLIAWEAGAWERSFYDAGSGIIWINSFLDLLNKSSSLRWDSNLYFVAKS